LVDRRDELAAALLVRDVRREGRVRAGVLAPDDQIEDVQ
jgi:hypothetical protein